MGLGRLSLDGSIVRLGTAVRRGFHVLSGDGAVDEVIEPRPIDFLELAGIPLDLRGLEGDPLGQHETHPTAGGVGPDPLQVPIPGHFLASGRLPVEHHRTVPSDVLDLGRGGRVLEPDVVVVEVDLLGVALDLVLPGFVALDPEQRPHVIGDQHRECLGGSAGGSDRPRVEHPDELRPVVVEGQLYPVDPFDRCCDDALGEQRHGSTDGPLDLALASVIVTDAALGEVPSQFEDGSFPPVVVGLKRAHPFRHPRDLEEVLHPVGHVFGDRDLDLLAGVLALCTGRLCHRERILEALIDPLEVPSIDLAHIGQWKQRERQVDSPGPRDDRPAGRCIRSGRGPGSKAVRRGQELGSVQSATSCSVTVPRRSRSAPG